MLHLKPYFLVLLLGITLLICACGQTGDLYLPEVANEPVLNESELNTESKKETSKN